uniref:Uncharacterized protein n=1 Tax=Anopheles melas TaxID=34690 RepID=A0A182TP42_9DIPT
MSDMEQNSTTATIRGCRFSNKRTKEECKQQYACRSIGAGCSSRTLAVVDGGTTAPAPATDSPPSGGPSGRLAQSRGTRAGQGQALERPYMYAGFILYARFQISHRQTVLWNRWIGCDSARLFSSVLIAHIARLLTSRKVTISRPGFLRMCSWVAADRRLASSMNIVWQAVSTSEARAVISTSTVSRRIVKWPPITVNVL